MSDDYAALWWDVRVRNSRDRLGAFALMLLAWAAVRDAWPEMGVPVVP